MPRDARCRCSRLDGGEARGLGFVTGLALIDDHLAAAAKVGILTASALAAGVGWSVLRVLLPAPTGHGIQR